MKIVFLSLLFIITVVLILPNVFAEDFSAPEWLKILSVWWINDEISDGEFVIAIEFLIKDQVIILPESYRENNSELPDWLINNAGWWSARILTDSYFENFDAKYTLDSTSACDDCIITTNNHGFRGNDITKEKSQNMYRIFAVGGSTTYGGGVNDNETWPFYLQKEFELMNLEKNVQVVNAGIMSATTNQEGEMIRERLLGFDPDLIIMYDGWNDSQHLDVYQTIDNWKSICQLGNENGFDTLVVVQPLVDSGHRILTNQEITSSQKGLKEYDNLLEKLDMYTKHFGELNDYCTKTADFRLIFDYVDKPIFFDYGHTSAFGNKIISDNVIVEIVSIISNKIDINNDIQKKKKSYDSNQYSIYAASSDLSKKNFDGLDLTNAIFDNSDLNGSSFINTNLVGARFVNADLSNSVLSQTDLSNTNLSGANLSGQDFSNKDLTGTILVGANLSNTNLDGVDLSGRDLSSTNLSFTDLSNMDLSGTNLSYTNLLETNFQNVDLSDAIIIDSDFTKIKNKSLVGANVVGAQFSYSDLRGINVSGLDFSFVNFKNVNLSGLDFTNSNFYGTIFYDAKLVETNLSGVDLSPKSLIYTEVFYGKADMMNIDSVKLANILWDTTREFIISKTADGNDLIIEYFLFTDLRYADLTNADLQGANLQTVVFSNTNLTGANLANSDLKRANLSNANLDGANISGANLENAIIKCSNHTICE